MPAYVMNGGQWRQTQGAPYLFTGGAWHKVQQGWIMNGGQWKQIWLPAYNDVFALQVNWSCDRQLYVSLNLRTGATNARAPGSDGDGRTHVNSFSAVGTTVVPNIQQYRSLSARTARVDTNTTSTVTISQQPNASNDYTLILHIDDDAWSNSHDGVSNIYFTATP